MDTVYYTFTARRVKVSGGPDLVKFVPAAAPVGKSAGEVLDFQRCRQRLETHAALRQQDEEALAPPEEETPEGPVRPSGWGLAAIWLELGASLSVLAVSAAAVAAFLAL